MLDQSVTPSWRRRCSSASDRLCLARGVGDLDKLDFALAQRVPAPKLPAGAEHLAMPVNADRVVGLHAVNVGGDQVGWQPR